MEAQPVQVICYSAQAFAERPIAFLWQGAEHSVAKVDKEWREPGEKHFRVRTDDDRLFELCYHEASDRWSATEWVLKSAKGGSDEQGSA